MHALEIVDELYGAFAGTLEGAAAELAPRLATTLGLSPSATVPWSQVFGHAITLAAPALLVDAMPNVDDASVRDAVLAHMLAVIEAFGSDRIEDGQVPSTPALHTLLARMRRARDAAVARLGRGERIPTYDDAATLGAIARERALLQSGSAVSFATYERISLGKQSPGFPAAAALAVAAGWEAPKRKMLERMLASVWLGLQMHDDAVDWEDDFRRGGAWAVAIAGGCLEPMNAAAHLDEARRRVHASGALVALLDRARRHYRAARRRAGVLGARTIEAWAAEREGRLLRLLEAERAASGYVVRAHALAAWAGEVLA